MKTQKTQAQVASRPRGAAPFGKRFFLALLLMCGVCLSASGTVCANPVIGVTPTVISFSGTAYSEVGAKTVTVSNDGDSVLNYSIAADAFWLTVSNNTGTLAAGANMSHTIYVSTRGLAPQTYRARLTVSDPLAVNSPQHADVTLTIGAGQPRPVRAWGLNDREQCNVPAHLTSAIGISGGGHHSLALDASGRVVAWGWSGYGQIDVPSAALANVHSVEAGYVHSSALKKDGTIVAWGKNDLGQCNVPHGLADAVALSSTDRHSLAVRANGTVLAWGWNDSGQCNVPEDLTNIVAVAAGTQHSLALRSDGTVTAWGRNDSSQCNVPEDLTNAVAVAAGGGHSMALRSDGTVSAWGANGFGECSVPAAVSNLAVAISVGICHSLALLSDGTVVAWGWDLDGQARVPEGLTSSAIAGGRFHSLALGEWLPIDLVVESSFGSPSPPRGTNWVARHETLVCSIDAAVVQGSTQYVCRGWTGTGDVPAHGESNYVSRVISSSSSITWLWATNYLLEVNHRGAGSVTPSGGWYPASSNVTITAIPEDGYIFLGWSGDTDECIVHGQTITVPMTYPRKLHASFSGPGMEVSPAELDFSGSLFEAVENRAIKLEVIGAGTVNYTIESTAFWLSVSNAAGTLTTGESTQEVVNVNSMGLSPGRYEARLIADSLSATNGPRIINVTLTVSHPAPPTVVKVWGNNSEGQCDVPPLLTNAVAIALGLEHVLALRADGTVSAWGLNNQGQCNVPEDLTNAIAVAAGQFHSLAVRKDGSVVAWGSNGEGQCIVPLTVTNAVSVAGGYTYSLAVLRDGTVAAWGRVPDYLAVPPQATNVIAVAAGSVYCRALRRDGTVVGWGCRWDNGPDPPTMPYVVVYTLTNAVAVAPGRFDGTGQLPIALCSDGRVVGLRKTPEAGPVLHEDAVAISGNLDGIFVLPKNRTLHCDVGILSNVLALAKGYMFQAAIVPGGAWVEVDSVHGTPSPHRGRHWVVPNLTQTLTVDAVVEHGTTQYVCVGWEGTGSVPANGSSNHASISITEDSAISWLWSTNYWLDLFPGSQGTVIPSVGWYAAGSNIMAQAFPDQYYHFEAWTGTVNAADNPLTLMMDKPHALNAVFSATRTVQGVPEWWLARHGWTNNFDAAALADPDGDGAPTWAEYYADTNPTNQESVLTLTGIVISNGTPVVTWKGGVQALQYLECTADPAASEESWQIIFTNMPPTSVSGNWLHSGATNSALLYRIKVIRE